MTNRLDTSVNRSVDGAPSFNDCFEITTHKVRVSQVKFRVASSFIHKWWDISGFHCKFISSARRRPTTTGCGCRASILSSAESHSRGALRIAPHPQDRGYLLRQLPAVPIPTEADQESGVP